MEWGFRNFVEDCGVDFLSRAGFSWRAKSSCFFWLWKFWDTCGWFISWIGDVFFGEIWSFVFAAMAGRGEGTFIGFSFLARPLGAAQPFRSTLFALQTRCYGIRVTAPRFAGRGRGMCFLNILIIYGYLWPCVDLVCFWHKNFVFLEIFMNKVEIYNSDYTKLNHAYILIFQSYQKLVQCEDAERDVLFVMETFLRAFNPALDRIKSEMTVQTRCKEDPEEVQQKNESTNKNPATDNKTFIKAEKSGFVVGSIPV